MQLSSKLGWWTLFGAITAFWFFHALGYIEDDAFIHLVYAKNVHNGLGFLFNDQISNGDTSPVWVLMLSLGGYFTSDWITIGKACSTLAVLFFAVTYYRYCASLNFGAETFARHLPGALLVLFAINPYFVYWSFSGMECIFAAGWLMLTCMSVTKQGKTNLDLIVSAVLLGCSPLIRPEMSLLMAIGGCYLTWEIIVDSKTNQIKVTRPAIFLALILILLPLALWSAYAIDAFGYVMPNTNAAKRAAPGDSVVARLIQTYGFGFPGILIGCAWLIWTYALGLFSRNKRAGGVKFLTKVIDGQPRHIIFFTVYVCIVSVFYVANHTYVQTRYILVLAPGMMAILIALMWKDGRTWAKFLTLGLSATIALYLTSFLAYPHISNKVRLDADTARVADFINHVIPANSKIGIYSIGEFGLLIKQHIVDIGGITQPEAAQFLNSPDDMLQWAKRQGAEYYIATDPPEEGSSLVYEEETSPVGWSFSPGYYDKKVVFRLWKLAPAHQQ